MVADLPKFLSQTISMRSVGNIQAKNVSDATVDRQTEKTVVLGKPLHGTG